MKDLAAQNQKGFALLLIILLVVVAAGVSYLGYRLFMTKPQISSQNTYQQTPQKPPEQKSVTSNSPPRSKASGVITQVVTAKGVDLKTGEAINPISQFSKTDKTIFVVLTLKNPKVGTKFEYVRYLNGKFLDHGNLTISKASTNNVSFNWILKKPGLAHPIGNYKVKVYTNGVFEKDINYIVQ